MESPTALEEKRSRLLNTATSYVDTALREGRALRPGEDAEVTAIETKISEIDRTLGRYTRLNRDGGEPGMVFVRCVRALAGHRSLDSAIQVATGRRWPDVARALSASVATAGGFAVPQGYQNDVVAALRPLVSVRRLNPIVVPMPNGNLFWPRINTGGTAGYISENSIIAATQEQFGAVNLTAKKGAALTPISNTLLRSSSPAADVIVKTDLVAALGATEDYYLLRGDGTNNTPRGIRNWAPAANVFTAPALAGASLAAADVAAVDLSLSQLELALINASVKMVRPGWILSPRTALALKSLRTTSGARAFPEMKDGMLKGYPYAISANVPTNLTATPMGGSQSSSCSEIVFADFGYVVLGEFPVVIDASGQGSYTDANQNVVSAFASDQTIVRVILQSDIGIRRDEAVAVLTAVPY